MRGKIKMLEIAEALNKYTVVQLFAATPVLFIIWLIFREINSTIRGNKNISDEPDTTKILAETLGGIIANELKNVVDSVRSDQQANTQEHQFIIDGMNRHGEIMERVTLLITAQDNKSETLRRDVNQWVGTLSDNLTTASGVIQVMNTDIDKMKRDLEVMRDKVTSIEQRITQGVPLDAKSQELIGNVIASINELEKRLKMTKETPSQSEPIKKNQEDKAGDA
jgi:hypothetical protein